MPAPLWPHQREFGTWMRGRASGVIDGYMGTGKTRCAIELARERQVRTALVLCPHSVVPGWERQLEENDPGCARVALSRGTVVRRAKQAELALSRAAQAGQRCWVVVNYEAARSAVFAKWAGRRAWDLLVLDELHRIKAPHGVGSKSCAKLRPTARCALGMSGTLMPHSPLDVFAEYRAVDPRVFGWSWVAFRNQHAVMGGFEGHEVVGYRNLDGLRKKMSSCTFQISREVLSLPEAVHVVEPVELSPRAAKIYRDMERDLVARVETGEVTASNALVKLLRLQQVTGGAVPVIDDDGEDAHVTVVDHAKEERLREMLEDLPVEEPVVVFCRFIADLDAVHRAASDCGDRPRRSMELSGRRKELEEWQAGHGTVLAVQIKSGGVGIDLTRAARAVFYSTGFCSPGDHDQAISRLHRPGQKKTVTYHHLVARDTIDEVERKAREKRGALVESILSDLTSTRRLADVTMRRMSG